VHRTETVAYLTGGGAEGAVVPPGASADAAQNSLAQNINEQRSECMWKSLPNEPSQQYRLSREAFATEMDMGRVAFSSTCDGLGWVLVLASWVGLGWVHKLMGWFGLGEEKWTHVHLRSLC